jgi:hypothetical protein
VLTGPQIRSRLGLDDTWAYFTRVSSSQAQAARAATSRSVMAGAFIPTPRSRKLRIERRDGGDWEVVGAVRTSARGDYRATLPGPGVYRVRGGQVAGPAVRVR